MSPRHSLLERQLRKYFPTGTSDRAVVFIEAIDLAYQQFDDDRHMLERALDLSSQELMQANRELKRSVSLLQSTFESTADGILVADGKGNIVSFNLRFAQMWQIPAFALASRDDESALAHALGQLKYPDQFLAKVRELYGAPLAESFDVLEMNDGRTFERYSIPQKIDGLPVGRVWSFRDVTARKQAEERLVHDAIHDGLTALPNRTLFLDRLVHAIRRSKRSLDHPFALLFVDLDRFKDVNDSLGHLAGDELLVEIATRIRGCVRPGDTVARLGGDEFTILLDAIDRPEDAIRAAERVQRAVAAPFDIRGTEIFTTVSIGIAVSAPHYVHPEELLRDADIAMYRAKAKGRAGFEVFQPGMHTHAVALLQLENDLRRAVERHELVLHYQPIVSLGDNRIVGFEALLRWSHPSRGLLYPEDFLAVAEETGLIVDIGRWALREACMRMREWQQSFGRDDLEISVNLSGRQLVEPSLVAEVRRTLRESALPPRTLCVELTETVLMENSQTAMLTLAQLRDLGVQVHIDDFGTGYSSLSYLHRFPVDTLKIDRSFISHIETGDKNLEIIRTIMTLARNLKMNVIAEGVENEMQRTQLVALGCHAAQGFLFSMAADNMAVQTMIGSGHWSGHAVSAAPPLGGQAPAAGHDTPIAS
jgi:PAS domain S-box/diguanylate cyclase (GGDEF) domain